MDSMFFASWLNSSYSRTVPKHRIGNYPPNPPFLVVVVGEDETLVAVDMAVAVSASASASAAVVAVTATL